MHLAPPAGAPENTVGDIPQRWEDVALALASSTLHHACSAKTIDGRGGPHGSGPT